ncbi:MAG: phosphomethylpyrimidine synthase ThiC, partial [Halothiobacillaceae bacterium]|nr:phosphomethylpyrimidine synthase ThiC [Halothiobacillaceae bacterium]
MAALAEDIFQKSAQLSAEVTKPFTGSRKIFVQGSTPDIRVPMREVSQTPTRINDGIEPNPPIYVYDTSGPYTDPTASIDLLKGLPEVRLAWIEARGDTEALSGPSSEFGQARAADPKTAHLRFEHIRAPRIAKAGQNVSQMHYAKKGIITPEM